MDENKLDFMNIKQVANMAKAAGQFILFDHEKAHYITTTHFMLQLRRRDAFLLQCKLEIEQRGIWYTETKKGLVGNSKKAELFQYVEKYVSWTGQAESSGESLTPTGILLQTFQDTPLNGQLYAGADGYTVIRADLLAMLHDTPKDLRRVGDNVVINGRQVVAALQDVAWKDNPYITGQGVWAALNEITKDGGNEDGTK